MSECDPQKHGCLKDSASLESPTTIDGNPKVTSGELSVHTYRQLGYSESLPRSNCYYCVTLHRSLAKLENFKNFLSLINLICFLIPICVSFECYKPPSPYQEVMFQFEGNN